MATAETPATTDSTDHPTPESAPASPPPADPGAAFISLQPSQRRLWLVLLALSGLVAAGYGIHYLRSRPDPVRTLFVQQLPRYQLGRGKGIIPAGSPELAAMQATLRRHPAVGAALAQLDAAYPDAEAIRTAGVGLSDALFAAHLPYYLDPQPIQQTTFLLSYAVVGQASWQAGGRSLLVRRLSRLDHLNIEMGLLGQTARGRPVVFLDRIEAAVIRDLLDASSRRKGSRPGRPLTDADQAALYELRRVLAARAGEEAIDALVAALTERDEAIETMRRRLHGGRLEISKPESFVFEDAWFEKLWPLTSLNNPGGPLIIDTDLRTVEFADAKLRRGAAQKTIAIVLDAIALGTEAHETRHALDDEEESGAARDPGTAPPRPVPPGLLALTGNDAVFAEKAERELRAYLGELHDSPAPPCLTLVQSVRLVRGRYVRPTPHFFAHAFLLSRLGGDETLADPVALIHRLCAEPEPALRGRVAALWKEIYGSDLQAATRRAL